MKNLETSIKLYDMMSAPLQRISEALTKTVDLAAKMQLELDGANYDGAMFDSVRANIASLNVGLNQTAVALERNEKKANIFGHALTKLVAPITAIFTLGKAIKFVGDSLDFADGQIRVERQLNAVLKNVGASKYAFERLKAAAGDIQSRTMYGDEAMIGGAAEFATYMSDSGAIESMMGTLANYAAGMSGGQEVTQEQMIDYATQLGKAFDGTYDGLKKKGFELTEQQKYIIETGTEMQKALVIDEVINQSWAGLAEQMASTPQGQIQQIRNLIGDIREEVGMYLYPHVMRLYQVILDNMPHIKSGLTVVASGLSFIIGITTATLNIVFILYGVITAVFNFLKPALAAVTMALAVYYGWKLLVNGALLIWHSRTLIATAAQWAFNRALIASPITKTILGITLLIGCLNHLSGTTMSVADVFFGVVNFVITLFVELYNLVAVFANYFATVFNNPVAAIVYLFAGLFDFILGIVENAAELIDIILGSDMSSAVAGWRKSMEDFVVDLVGEQTVVMQKLNAVDYHVGADLFDGLFGGGSDAATMAMARDIEETAYNTGEMREAISMTQEDLKYLRDIAERDVINRFTTAEIKVEVHNDNKITSDVDAAGLFDQMGDFLTEQIVVAAEGVHR